MYKNSNTGSMQGAGIEYKDQKYITHTTLPFSLSAAQTFTWSQRIFIALFLLTIITGFIFVPLLTLQILVSFISILYFIDTVFNLSLTLRSLHKRHEITISPEELSAVQDQTLPVYTILCPLYKEAHVIPQFVQAIEQLDWPKEKLDVMLLLEEDDTETITAVAQMNLPSYLRTVIVPDSQPKTKPKACNYGLSFARGEYLVIFDAEDIPDPLQLKKAYLAFQKVPNKVKCLQAKLNYYNARQNILTRFFTAEYSLWFDLTLTGIQSFNSTIPLGGTSNHFKTEVLKELEGWDPFNVTEDADLGIRLFKRGFQTAIIDSTTYEEATSKPKNWIRQRSRWIKGYMQTYLVHMRTWKTFLKEKGLVHNLIFQLTVGGKLLFLLLNPFMWIMTILYFAAFGFVGPTIEIIYRPPISYIAVISWIFGNFLFLYYYMLGCARRNQWDLMKYIFMIPFYWGMMSTAAVMALYQLIFKPHYWEKTIHGFHLGITPKPVYTVATAPPVPQVVRPAYIPTPRSLPSYAAIENTMTSKSSTNIMLSVKKRFLPFSLWRTISVVMLLVFDLTLARIFLPQDAFATYFMLSLTCKAICIGAQAVAYVVNGFLSKNKKPEAKFYDLLFAVFLAQWIGFVIFGFEGGLTIPLLFGHAFLAIVPYIAFYLFACMCFAIANVFGHYYLRKKSYAFTMVSLFTLLLQGILISLYHQNIKQMITILAYLGTVDIMGMIFLHINRHFIGVIENNVNSFFTIFKKTSAEKAWQQKNMRILIFNWRDTKHVYAGGAEVYIQELAKRWVKDGNKVTIFCGNDNKNAATESVDGVEVVRRGGTYTVYLFAFLYYLLKFRGKYDIIIDCENGIPFFAPLFSRRPVILLIHHVHQEVFREFLKFPLKHVAAFLEGKVMPFVYRNKVIITVSDSSKKEIVNLGFTQAENIEVIYNGVKQVFSEPTVKTPEPSFMYLGRLKEYKNIDIAIKAFALLTKDFPTAQLSIVGYGEHELALKQLVEKLHLTAHVTFFGRVTEEEKTKLLSQSWAMLQPSQIEGWGITVIEANAAGTPVIASKVNGLQDSVVEGKTGLLVQLKNIHQFAQAMHQIASEQNYRNELSQQALAWSRNFDWDKSANDFYKLIGKSLGRTQAALVYGKSFAEN
ncbi:MAG TPA: glycosyltransferase [Methylomirabilota bacterium]|nr:glycosyltransferase [Methylomirabilota bacterium]